MYTVLLIDDEQPILDTLLSSIPWSQFGVETLLTARDGAIAWEIIQSRQIDLLITDIRMPHMDGIELLKRVRARYPSIHSILLTAYSEFEYAREAIRLGVENYLLKPFQEQELEETIEKALDNIYASRQNSEQLFRSNILMRWVSGSINIDELSERASLLNINIYLPSYCAVCIAKRESAVSLASYRAQCQALLSEDYAVYRFLDDSDRRIFIIGGVSLDTQVLARLFCQAAEMENVTDLVTIAIGTVVDDSISLPSSYQSACQLMASANLLNAEMVLYANDNYISANSYLTEELLTLFSEQDETIRKTGYENFLQKISSGADQSASAINRHTKTLSSALLRLFTQEFMIQKQMVEQLKDRLWIFSASDREHFMPAAMDMLEYSFLLYNYHFKSLSPIIQYAIDYIHGHYMESLSIKEFSAKYKTNTDYLGYLFKKETGMFFNNYLTQHRICCSMTLLRDSNARINDIALKVGFTSASYFISCFKKQIGMSPIKYRTMRANENI